MNAVGTPTTAHVADTTHTPTGRHDATLTSAHPDNPTTHTTHTPLDHTPQPDPARIEDTRLSNTDTDSAGKENHDVARTAALLAGLPASVPGVTVDRLCASGLKAVIQAARGSAAGDAHNALAGGV